MPSTLCSMAPFPLSESLGSGIRPGKTCDAIVSCNQRLDFGPAQAENLGSDGLGSLFFSMASSKSPTSRGGCQRSPQNGYELELLKVTSWCVYPLTHLCVSRLSFYYVYTSILEVGGTRGSSNDDDDGVCLHIHGSKLSGESTRFSGKALLLERYRSSMVELGRDHLRLEKQAYAFRKR